MLDWYGNYVRLHRSWHRGITPTALVTFCGEGGVSEGVRRAGGASHGQDIRRRERYERRFGGETFSQGDSRSPHELRRMSSVSFTHLTVPTAP